MEMRLFQRIAMAIVIVATFALAACDKDTPTSTPDQTIKKAACLGFNITITSGPDSGMTFDGDLMMSIEPSGFFKAALEPSNDADRASLFIGDSTRITNHATGQANGTSVTWILYTSDGKPLFGSGMIDLDADPQTLRGMVSGPAPNDIGIFHGRWFPPYIRTVS
jgi:hypothetical protein